MAIRVFGHQRSGNHYLAALLNENFFHYNDYTCLFPKNCHGLPDAKQLMKIDKPIYIYRKRDDVLKSVFTIRKRFGLDMSEYEDFLITKYSDMFDPLMESEITMDIITQKDTVYGISKFFKKINYTPVKWHDLHIASWKEALGNRIKIVSYEDLKANFKDVMEDMLVFLEIEKPKEIKNIDKKVGWFDAKL